MVKKKKIPMRMCLGCQEMRPKKELIRIVKTPEDMIEVDPGGKRSGRGAYICPVEECLHKAIKGRRLEKAFGRSVTPEVVETLKERLVNSGVQRI